MARITRRVAGCVLRVVSRTVSLRRAPCRALSGPYRGTSLSRVVPVSRHTQRPGLARLSQYVHSYRDTIPQQLGPFARAACLALKPAVSWPVSAVSWSCPRPYRGPVRPFRGLSRLYRGRVPSRIVALAACPCAPCVTIQCTVS